ncbi:MAG: ornithine carbamoyltransferase [Chloroflexi bacterium]|nr:ornithine carbamoyltransferase [Chloroflexota bacterium]
MDHFIELASLDNGTVRGLLQSAHEIKAEWKASGSSNRLRGKILGMIFEKPSLRTRVSFDVGMLQLGGHALMLGPQEIGINSRESTADIARTISRYVDGVMIRTFAHSIVQEFASFSSVAVINGLTDATHPCQAMADVLTIEEHFGRLSGIQLVYIGDGNNVARSLLWVAAHFGMNFTLVSPRGYELPQVDHSAVASLAKANGANIIQSHDPHSAVKQADAIYTDVWVSMGMDVDQERRNQDFLPYQVNAALLQQAPSDAIIMHDLPAHRGEEITDEVADGPQSKIFDQAENRLHAQKAILVALMGSED